MAMTARTIALFVACVFGVLFLVVCAGDAGAESGPDSGPRGLTVDSVRVTLSSLPYEMHLRQVKAPPQDAAAFRGYAIGKFHAVLRFSIGLGRDAVALPLPGIGTRFAVYNGEFVFNSNGSEGKDFASNAQWKVVAKMEVTIEERLCRRATGEACAI